MACPDANQLAAFLGGTLDPGAAQELATHLDGCSACDELIGWLVRADRATARLAPGADSPGADGQAPRPLGSVFGRYVLLGFVGAGGMGLVYAAFDPKLDRKVALKLVHDDSAAARARVEREARLAARLQHPNVIAVHDVGMVDDRICISMEYVDGVTLAEWIRGPVRPYREVLGVVLQAARGLAAAHGAGLVHRDFKPSNVIVGHDGRVRVLDFGLARAVADAPGGSVATSRAIATADASSAGARVGSPAYMAPEQHRGEAADAAADQFAFCVTLHEALYRRRPFAGGTVEHVAANVLAGRIDDPPQGASVPNRLRRVILRGLSADPRARFESMDVVAAALEREIERDAAGRGRRIAVAAAVTIIVGVSGLAWLTSRPAKCHVPDRELAGTWDPSIRAAAGEAFRATGHPFAEQAFTAVAAALDGYSASIGAGILDACEATQVRGEQSEAMRDLRVRCLDTRRLELRALAVQLEQIDGDRVPGALSAARSLPDVADCSDLEALSSPTPLPRDPGLRARIAALGPVLAEGKALNALGRFRPALPLLATGVALARATGYQPLVSELLVDLSAAREDAGDLPGAETALVDAVTAAVAGRADPTAVIALHHLAVLASRADRFEDAERWVTLAWAIVQRIGAEQGMLGGMVYLARGQIAAKLGHLAESRALTLEALRRLENQVGRGDVRLASTLMLLAGMTADLDAHEARGYIERAITNLEGNGEHDGPERAEVECQLAIVVFQQGRYEEAAAIAERGLAMMQRIFGDDSLEATQCMAPLAAIDVRLDRDDEALALYRRVRAARASKIAADNSSMLEARIGIAGILAKRGDLEASALEYEAILAAFDRKGDRATRGAILAQALAELASVRFLQLRVEEAERLGLRALTTVEKFFGSRSDNIGAVELLLGDIALRKGRTAEAQERLARALGILEGSANPLVLGDALVVVGRLELARGRPREARLALERARGIYKQFSQPDTVLAEVEVPLAEALGRSGERERARSLALEARDALRRHHPTEERTLVELLGRAEALLQVAPATTNRARGR